jgi:hypothetical protein
MAHWHCIRLSEEEVGAGLVDRIQEAAATASTAGLFTAGQSVWLRDFYGESSSGVEVLLAPGTYDLLPTLMPPERAAPCERPDREGLMLLVGAEPHTPRWWNE